MIRILLLAAAVSVLCGCGTVASGNPDAGFPEIERWWK